MFNVNKNLPNLYFDAIQKIKIYIYTGKYYMSGVDQLGPMGQIWASTCLYK